MFGDALVRATCGQVKRLIRLVSCADAQTASHVKVRQVTVFVLTAAAGQKVALSSVAAGRTVPTVSTYAAGSFTLGHC